MDATTEIVYTIGAIAGFVALFFTIGRFFAYRAERLKRSEIETEQRLKKAAAERVRLHNEKLALASEGLVSANLNSREKVRNPIPKKPFSGMNVLPNKMTWKVLKVLFESVKAPTKR